MKNFFVSLSLLIAAAALFASGCNSDRRSQVEVQGEGDGLVAQTGVVIFDNDDPPVVVVPDQLEDQVQFAVTDLTNYLSRITGREAVLTTGEVNGKAIHIGGVAANQTLLATMPRLEPEGFVIDISEEYGVRIVGGGKFGTSYGISELLERIGVRWLAPGEWGEVVPDVSIIELSGGTIIDEPVFAVRQHHAARVGRPFGDWARRMRHNRNGFFGHSSLIPPRRHGEEHPEWYAEVEGERQVKSKNFKLCHSNQDMVRQAIEETLETLRKRRANTNTVSHIGYRHLTDDYKLVSVSPTDGGGFCQCARCLAAGSLSDRLQVFANTIGAAIQAEFPGYKVAYYGAYSAHQDAPTVKASKDVVVVMTSWTKSFFKNIDAPINRDFREKVASFASVCPELIMRDYDGLSSWWGFGPYTLGDIHAYDYRWYRDNGVQGFITEAHAGWAPRGYSYYLTSKLWWNPEVDLAALKEDYVVSGFGEAAAPMRRYHQRLDEAVVYPAPAVLYAMRQDLEEAARLAKRPDVRRRIDYMRAYYYILDIYTDIQNGKAGEDEALIALKVLASVDPLVSPLGLREFNRALGREVELPEGLSSAELAEILAGVELRQPSALAHWSDDAEANLKPWDSTGTNWVEDMGANYRYGPHEMLIYAQSGERITIRQEGRTQTEFQFKGPEYATLAEGTTAEEGLVDLMADSEGIYRLTISTRGFRPRILISNRGAVVKASSALQHLHPMHRSIFYFYVPKGTREFAFVTKAEEPLYLEVHGPYDAEEPVYPRTMQKAQIFMEHIIKVPDGADGKAWRVRIDGEDKKVFLQGIPPFFASHPERLLIIEDQP